MNYKDYDFMDIYSILSELTKLDEGKNKNKTKNKSGKNSNNNDAPKKPSLILPPDFDAFTFRIVDPSSQKVIITKEQLNPTFKFYTTPGFNRELADLLTTYKEDGLRIGYRLSETLKDMQPGYKVTVDSEYVRGLKYRVLELKFGRLNGTPCRVLAILISDTIILASIFLHRQGALTPQERNSCDSA